MKAVVFGGTGFIGSHVVEQLVTSGHTVTAIARPNSNTRFLKTLDINIVSQDLTRLDQLSDHLSQADVVYNCTARPHPNLGLKEHRRVEVTLTRQLAEATVDAGVARFVQLSTVQVHGSETPAWPMTESTPRRADTDFQQAYIEREDAILEVGQKTGLEVSILRPASTIGSRDRASFFSRLYQAYLKGQFPLIDHGNGGSWVSLIDTRDIGRAMEWLGHHENAPGNIYLAKGYDVRWSYIKEAFDRSIGPIPQKKLPPEWILHGLARFFDAITRPPKMAPLSRFAVLALTRNTLIDDTKLRSTGFETKFSFEASVQLAINDLQTNSSEIQ